MVLTSFLILFLVLLIYLMLLPIVLFIDTATNQYYIQLKGLAKASLESHQEELIRIKLKIFFMNFYFYPLKNIGKTKTIDENKISRTKKKSKERFGITIRKGIKVLKSFKMKKCFLDIDTDDCILNAKLYPVFTFLSYNKAKLNINFVGRNRMVLHIVNRPIHIIKSFINL